MNFTEKYFNYLEIWDRCLSGVFLNIKDITVQATEYDKKKAVETRKPKSWKSISAFTNGIRGVLIFGISDADMVIGEGMER